MTPEDVQRLALEAIPETPQIIMDPVAILQAQEEDAAQAAAEVLEKQRAMLEQDRNPVAETRDAE